jgi:Transposase DDE domain/Transposase domain (DUF772)
VLGKRSAQRGLFEADTRYGEFVGQRTFYGYLASQRDELFRDEDFAALYSRHRGRPSVPPSLLATALVLQTYDGVSDEEAKQRADYDLRWKVALGLEVETRPFAKSTLQEFRAQLIVHDKTRAIFQRSLEVAKHRGVWKKGKAPEERRHIKLALDTTYILGRGAVRDTYNLLADGIVQVLRGLAELVKCELLEVAEELDCTRYVSGSSLKGQAEVDWSDPQARQRFLAEIVHDAEQVLEVVRGTRSDLTKDSPEDKALVAAAELLARILDQDIERDEGGPRIQRGVAPDRLISVHDPEMRHGRKSRSHRFDGHKTQVAVDTDSQLITAVEVLAGNAPDAEQALKVVEASEAATECRVAEVLGDCAYGAGETRAEFAAAGRTLIAKVPDLQNQGYFAKTNFQLDLEATTCTCPNQQTTSDFRASKGGGGVFVFDAESCAVCPLRAQCTRSQGGRTVHVHPQEALLQQARTFQKSPAFAEFRRRRQVVEHRLARLVQLGIRQARYLGRTKTLFQLCLAAAVANLTLMAASSDASTVDHLRLVLSLLVALLAILSLMVGSAITISASITRPIPIPRFTSPSRYKPLSRPAF